MSFSVFAQAQPPEKPKQVCDIDGNFWVQLTSQQKVTVVLGYLIGMSSVEGLALSTKKEIESRTDPQIASIQYPDQASEEEGVTVIKPDEESSSIKFSTDEAKFFTSWADFLINWSSYPETVAGIVASVDSFYSKYSNRDAKLFMVIPYIYDHEWW
jgi:hypothetical protein